MMATLLLSIGVPMINGGDELGRSQKGNNNPYCQDNEISWYCWDDAHVDREFLKFVIRLVQIRNSHPVLLRRRFLKGKQRSRSLTGVDVLWLRADGHEMSGQSWADPDLHTLGMLLDGDRIHELGEDGQYVRGATLLVLYNSWWQDVPFKLPPLRKGKGWRMLMETSGTIHPSDWLVHSMFPLYNRSVALFKLV